MLPICLQISPSPSLLLTLILVSHLLTATRPQVRDGIARIFFRELIVPSLPCITCSLGLKVECDPLVRLRIVWKLLVDHAMELLELQPLEMVVRFKLMTQARAPVVIGSKVAFASMLSVFQIWNGRRLVVLGRAMWY